MTNPTFDFNVFIDASKKAFAPALKFNELTAKQVELTTQLVEKTTQRSQDLVKLATEQQAELSKWYDKAAADYASVAKKAA